MIRTSIVLAATTMARGAARVDFSRDVRPILAENCFKCHGPDAGARKGDLRLDVLDPKLGPLAARDGYWIVSPGRVDDSVMILRVTSDDPETVMPPPSSNRKLTARQIEVLKRWVGEGAPWGEHWAFVKPVRPGVPKIDFAKRQARRWDRNPIDAFVLAKLEGKGIAPSPEADRATLIRRVSLDLVGLPPTVQEVDAFVKDTSPDAYERVVDRLLASPHYGERQARHWLDGARYADSNGYSHDFPRSIWPYRDYVIDAFNTDMPYDRFVIEQLAGDMLPNATLQQKVATGFHRNTQFNTEGGIDPEQFRVEAIIDRVATTGTVLLGLTTGCAQCHDHKFDPISQREYYELFAFFNNCDEPTLKVTGITDAKQVEDLKAHIAQLEGTIAQKVAGWEGALTEEQKGKLKADVRAALAVPARKRDGKQDAAIYAALRAADNDFGALVDDLASLKKQLAEGATTLVMEERKDRRKTTVLIKGDFTRPGEEVEPGFPAAVSRGMGEDTAGQAGHGTLNRLDLARWIVSSTNPLTARVRVNRIWAQYFGRGLVETENDFGTQGAVPTHPELLDWLATEFVGHGWSEKHIHKLIVMSAAYRQASKVRPELAEVDPYNKLLARQVRVRLDAEVVRDVALGASGLLSEKVGGPSVYPPIPAGVLSVGQVNHPWPTSVGPERYRRGLYTFTFRNSLHPALGAFDAPDATSACTRRMRSNTPLQALNLLNDTAWMEFARALAGRTLKEVPTADDDARIDHMFELVTARRPADDERGILRGLLEKKRPAGERGAWTLVARVVLNLDEAITRE